MSKVVRGVVDLPHVDLRDTDGVYETILFLIEQNLLSEYFQKAKIDLTPKGIALSWRQWEYIIITPDGHILYDDHYGTMEEAKKILLDKINEFYPPVKKLMDVLSEAGVDTKKANVQWDREKEEIVVELEG